ncbi:AcrR family transcriptional regulator [Kibdelosporangium banguiense]|uniref:AcrR family transcriptional regulator n=1 Tax=Kibdelosporangium banguiense TaxID=1365924 RepID=A0ABS4TN65_9PSEU|nr:TetR/AcrR family transcriptional regulator [Kibdelosporangium banguiense]MBP2325848.1 AcrR family transcriptional regulator [Kibdelosporangium banguiense]
MAEQSRPLRADAARNRARVLQVAYETFAAEGLAVPIDEIARRAGVGAGTVYRHFPTKESLFQAIVADRMGHLIDVARGMAADDPGQGLFKFLHYMLEEGSADQGLADALAGIGIDLGASVPDGEREFMQMLAELLAAAQAAGCVRSDVAAKDVKTLLVGLQAMQRYRGDDAELVFRIVLDGLASSPGQFPAGSRDCLSR